jgi:hypothetical protein
MTNETRVGYRATSVLEEICLNYITALTINGKFEGDVHYTEIYQKLKDYNSQN